MPKVNTTKTITSSTGTRSWRPLNTTNQGNHPDWSSLRRPEPLILKHLLDYRSVEDTPHYGHLLEDPLDKQLFVNYLEPAFEFFPEDRIDYQLLSKHSEEVQKCLREHESNKPIRQKYEWVANYHNYVCRSFADRWLFQDDEETDLEVLGYSAEAQRVRQIHPTCREVTSQRGSTAARYPPTGATSASRLDTQPSAEPDSPGHAGIVPPPNPWPLSAGRFPRISGR